jgi:D-alanyl-D-alanine carboxypeptidase/D-alanyl-D-alanine-endopeptidase (penicillin-binding protein 4)
MPPASTLKLLTFSAAIDKLGKDYEFTTSIYKNRDNVMLKLGADPYLTSADLRELVKSIKGIAPKHFYVDDSIVDKKEWGEGWQWDDEFSPLMPKFSAYNLDGNLLGVVISPTIKGAAAEIRTEKFYPAAFENLVTTGSGNELSFSRSENLPDVIAVRGTVSTQVIKKIPVNSPKRYFMLRLGDAIRSEKLDYYGEFLAPPNTFTPELVKQIKHPISSEHILKNSNNLAAETVYKIAGTPLKDYAAKNRLDISQIRVVDGSGVSKNNLVTADFMTDFLVKSPALKEMLPTADEGTLKNRMLYFRDNVRAKTGTLSDVSALAGYITARSGKTYAFDIMINDPKSSEADKKSLEDNILQVIYAQY